MKNNKLVDFSNIEGVENLLEKSIQEIADGKTVPFLPFIQELKDSIKRMEDKRKGKGKK